MSEGNTCKNCGTKENVTITSYKEEGEGFAVDYHLCGECNTLERFENFRKDGYVTQRLYMEVWMEDRRREQGQTISISVQGKEDRIVIRRVNREINDYCKRFEDGFWFKGLQKFIIPQKLKGLSGEFEVGGRKIKILTYSMCGRCMITSRYLDNTADVTFITAEDSETPRMGVQSYNGNYNKILELCRDIVTGLSPDILTKTLVGDEEVSII